MRILATDFDNTLKRNGIVSHKDIRAIQRFREKGNLFGIVTGRNLAMLKPALKFFRIPFDFIIGDNGGFIVDHNFNLLYEKKIRFKKALEIIEDMKKENLGVAGFNNGYQFSLFTFGTGLWGIKKSFALRLLSVNPNRILRKGKILSFFLQSNDPKQVQRIYDRYKDDPEVTCVKNGTRIVDLSAPEVNKALAVERLKKIFQCDEVIVIGDSANDLKMIQMHHGYAICNAEKEVKEAARMVVTDFEELVKQIEE